MKNQFFGAFKNCDANPLQHYNKLRDDLPIAVNCAGVHSSPIPFSTYNKEGRADYYLLCVDKGTVAVDFPQKSIELKSGTAIIFPPEYEYKYHSKSGLTEYLFVHFSGSAVQNILNRLNIPQNERLSLNCGAVLKSKFSELFDAFIKDDEFSDCEYMSIFLSLLVIIAEAGSTASGNPLAKSVKYINLHFSEELPVPMLAQMENLSVSRYNAVFKSTMGESPVKYILSLRMNAAARLLLSTNLSVKEVAQASGYSDQRFFNKLFKREKGFTPGKYKQSV